MVLGIGGMILDDVVQCPSVTFIQEIEIHSFTYMNICIHILGAQKRNRGDIFRLS